jgi:hypothetical protein
MTKKKKPLTGRCVPPSGDGPFLIYKSLITVLEPSQFDAARWPVVEFTEPPADVSELRKHEPVVLFKGTYYAVELTPEAKAALDEPWLEMARVLGRLAANKEFDRQLAEKRKPK